MSHMKTEWVILVSGFIFFLLETLRIIDCNTKKAVHSGVYYMPKISILRVEINIWLNHLSFLKITIKMPPFYGSQKHIARFLLRTAV